MKREVKYGGHTSSFNYNQNQQKAKPRRRRRTNMSLYYFCVLIFVVTALVVLSLTVFFNINTISILGQTKYTNEEIISYTNVKNGDNLYRIDLEKIKENILKNLVYISDVTIKRKLPSKLQIEVTPCVEAAYIKTDDKKYLLIDGKGKILCDCDYNEAQDKGYPIIIGFEPESCNVGEYISSKDKPKDDILLNILSSIDSIDFKNINQIDLTDRLNMSILYDNRITIQLGASIDLSYKISFSKKIIDEQTNKSFSGKIVMRGNNEASLIKSQR